MPRHSRKSVETSFLHVMTQGIEKKFIFNYHKDIIHYINLMYKFKKEYEINIIAYCIMNNHSHMLLEVKSIKSLSDYMHKLNGAYGRYYNKKYNRVGFVFRDRFRSEGIYDEKHKYNCINYIYNNPVVAGICSKPEEYKYSNYRRMKNLSNSDMDFIDVEEDRNKVCKKIIKEFLEKNNLNIKTLKKEEIKLKEIVKILNDKNKFSYGKIAMELKINKAKLYRINNEK